MKLTKRENGYYLTYESFDNDRGELYYCDPSRNTTCRKTECYEGGGSCMCTSNPEYAIQGPISVSLVCSIMNDEIDDGLLDEVLRPGGIDIITGERP